ncbi:MAG: transcription termination factor Rho [Spirochaetales bacterium]|nr:transcription termination factor Rho [Spirochaetales bacterium]
MESEEFSETEVQAVPEGVQENESRTAKVVIKRAPRIRKIRKVAEEATTESAPAAEEVSEAPVVEEKTATMAGKERKRTSKNGPKSGEKKRGRRAKEAVKDSAAVQETQEELNFEEAIASEPVASSLEESAPVSESAIEEAFEAAAPAAEGAEAAQTPEEGAQKEERNERQGRFNKYDKRNRFDKKNGKMKDRRGQEETIPEVNLEENPDAPKLFISDLAVLPIERLRDMAREKGISEEVILDCRKQDLIKELMKIHALSGGALMVEGTIEVLPDGYGFIRYSINSYLTGSEDVYVSQGMVKGCGLRTGDTVYGQLKSPRDSDRFHAMLRITMVNGQTPQQAKLRVPFDTLTPLFANEKLHLEYSSNSSEPDVMDISTRVVDLFCPIGKGQRSLIVAPPRTGKTVLMQKIANAISTNHPEVHLIVLLVDERPEEVTDMRRSVKAEVVASTFDEQATRHVQVAEMVIEKAKRMVEQKKDVVILLDSITRLARAYNQTVPASGKILSGGVDSNALHKPKRFFGAARNIEEGGSLTIISTALIETGSRMDEVIFEEFKGTGNNEIVLDRRMADSRKFPAINIKKSGTRRDDLLLTKDEQSRLFLLRSAVGNMDDLEMSVFLIDKMKKTHNNKEFLGSMSSSAVNTATQIMSSVR